MGTASIIGREQKAFLQNPIGWNADSHAISARLGALRVQGINMAGCGVSAEVLQNMVAEWLDDECVQKGVDLRGNEINKAIAELFVAAGFEFYLQNRKQPSGYMFAKPL